jgi:acetyl esterase/lipase
MPANKQTYVYKTVAGCRIKADVCPASPPGRRPVVVWIHGGALIFGKRDSLPPSHRDCYLGAGWHVVSIDYRLAPEAKLPHILEDVHDACRWVREKGPALFGADPTRLGVVGHSAGGYLALVAGFRVTPRPRALVSFYGYGDIADFWYSRPDPHYCQQPLVSPEEAYAGVGGHVLSQSYDPERERFYLYCRQRGLWPQEVVGHSPDSEPEAFDPLCPVRNIAPDYPPTLLLHGDRDTDVPYEQSELMAAALARAGIQHDLVTIAEGEHGFDAGDTPAARRAFARVLAFLQAHL